MLSQGKWLCGPGDLGQWGSHQGVLRVGVGLGMEIQESGSLGLETEWPGGQGALCRNEGVGKVRCLGT